MKCSMSYSAMSTGPSRGGDPALQNIAQDMVINTYLGESRNSFFSRKSRSQREIPELNLPAGLPVLPSEFFERTGIEDPSWEEVYRWLLSSSGDNYYSFDGKLDLADSFGPEIPVIASEQEFDLSKMELKPSRLPDNKIKNELKHMQGMGFSDDEGQKMPTGVHLYHSEKTRREVDTAKKRTISLAERDRSIHEERAFQDVTALIKDVEKVDLSPWKHLLKSIVDFSSQSSEWAYSYSRFNKRYFSGGIYAPGRIFKEKQVLTVAVDVSASMIMKPGEIETAFGVIEELLENTGFIFYALMKRSLSLKKRGQVYSFKKQ